jgi:hypothetical protein
VKDPEGKDDNVTFIPAGEEEQDAKSTLHSQSSELIQREPWEERLAKLANSPGTTVRVPRTPDLKRTQVVDAFLDAFQLIGGTPRLAIWADQNPSEFFKLYAKLAPRQLEQDTTHDGNIKVIHVLPRGKLDQ